MSYAEIAASGPKQSAEEARAPPMPQLEQHDSNESTNLSLVDVDSPHVVSVKSDFEDQAIQTETQAVQKEHEAEDKARAEAKKAEQKAEAEAKKVKEEAAAEAEKAKAKAKELKEEASEKAEELKDKAAAKAKQAKKEIKKEAQHLDENKDNPVYVGNMILWSVTAVAVGYGAYKKNSEGKLDVQLVGTVAAGLGLLGAADYFASKWLVQNKYPTK